MGLIYIFTNPSFEEYVKIGYTDKNDIGERLKTANNCTFVPYAFRVYATYETKCANADKIVHDMIDNLKPELRVSDSVEGRLRKREFYAMSPEEAYSILETIAKVSGTSDKLKKNRPTESEKEEQKKARQTRANNFRFSDYGITGREKLEYYNPTHPEDKNTGETCYVLDDRHVEYKGDVWSMSSLAQLLSESKSPLQGPKYFKYNGTPLLTLREQKDSRNND